ncbi:MAG: hypothetical protein COA78_28405 [Blastopirellula sp.]|nr:MAG: hypothetical protein COA78_28405 [Blastopirellula sp.]
MSLFGNQYELPMNVDYVKHWGMAEAVRELIQNSLDCNSPFEYSFSSNAEGTHTLKLFSKFEQLLPKTLLLGTTSKADDPHSIGSFGEGYKIAMLVLKRMKYDMVIYNRDRIWKPHFVYNKKYEAEILVVSDEAAPQTNEGVTFAVSGLSSEDVEEIKNSCLHMQKSVGEVHETSQGRILLDRKGQLFVNGLYVCETEMDYGYDVKPEYLTLERDRQTVGSWELKSVTRDMWYDTELWDDIAKMMADEVVDMSYSEWSSPELLKAACFELFNKTNPNATVVRNQTELNELVGRGMVEVVIVNTGTYNAITGHERYNTSPAHVTTLPRKSPTTLIEEWSVEMRKHCRRQGQVLLKELVVKSSEWTNK